MSRRRPRRAPSLAGVAALVFALAPGSAASQTPEEIEAAVDAEARAVEFYQAGRFLDALGAFERAYGAVPEPRHLFTIASAYERIPGRCADGLRAWRRYLEVCGAAGAACGAKREAARTREARFAEICAPPLTITTDPAGAQVEVDGVKRGRSPLTVRLMEGERNVRATHAGHLPATGTVLMERARPQALELRLAPEAPVTTPQPPRAPEAQASDTESVGRAKAGYVLIGSGVALALTGGGLLVGAASYNDDFTTSCSTGGCDDDARTTGRALEIGGWSGVGVGAAALAVGVWVAVTAGEPAPVTLAPYAEPSSVGLAGTF